MLSLAVEFNQENPARSVSEHPDTVTALKCIGPLTNGSDPKQLSVYDFVMAVACFNQVSLIGHLSATEFCEQ